MAEYPDLHGNHCRVELGGSRCGELDISEITVEAERGQVMQKMKANSLADLVRTAAILSAPTRLTWRDIGCRISNETHASGGSGSAYYPIDGQIVN